jgi:hypothetical protein
MMIANASREKDLRKQAFDLLYGKPGDDAGAVKDSE